MRHAVARWAAVALLGILAAVVVSAPAAERPGALPRAEAARPEPPRPDGARPDAARQMPRMKMLQPGQAAPDFELPRLVVQKDKAGNTVGNLSQEKVKLSSFAGAKPVCLIFTSYT
ncbi:MAG: hypothetical protein IMZ44_12950 [Planctomycetes bacterium]|nr:hypothetical protein [Planctomycetota bacterium]